MQAAEALPPSIVELHPDRRSRKDRWWDRLAVAAVLAVVVFGGGWIVQGVAHIVDSSSSASANAAKTLSLQQIAAQQASLHDVTLNHIESVQAADNVLLRDMKAQLAFDASQIVRLKATNAAGERLLAYFEQNLTALCRATRSRCVVPPK